ncbi:MAG: peptidylprolyl isomerase [Fimbriimonadaceae bacterium]|nr:peptidylprolyl isomerase [Fimbriimonadaceae bacterium]QYK57157.1 MAG: peptidylprolyl isomerase [Fimbriimonadaceae bacterium]
MPKEGEEVAVLQTDAGRIVIKFYPEHAPRHVENFKELAKEGFYDGTRFHRCIPGFMVQGGDPYSKDMDKVAQWGTGGPDKRVKKEFNDLKHTRGVLSMARSQDPDSAGSQFFIMVDTAESLDHNYSGFGIVVEGMDVVDKIVATGGRTNNGMVSPEKAIVLKKVEIKAWPLDK